MKGYITKKGYRRLHIPGTKKMRMEHVLVWEKKNGPIPEGMQVHHLDHDKLNNRIENLQLVSPLIHKRIHSGCFILNGRWQKPCRRCGITKDLEVDFYKIQKKWPQSICKACQIVQAVKDKQARKQKAND